MNAERRAVAAVAFAAIAVFADMYLTQPLLPELGREYGVSATAASTTLSVLLLVIAATSSAYGPLADVIGRRTVMIAGSALLALATLAAAFAPSFTALVALRAVQGAFVPAVSAVAIPYLAQLRSNRDPGTLVGLYIGATVGGGMLGRVASGLIAAAWSWRASFVVFGALTFVASATLALTLRPGPPRNLRARESFAQAYVEMAAHLTDARLVGAFIVGGTLFFGFIGFFTYLPYLLDAPPFALTTAQIAWFYAAYLAGVFTAPLSGRLSRRVPRRVLMAAGFVIALVSIAATLVADVRVVAVATVVLCVGMFTAQAVAPAFVNVNARTAKGGANALYQAFYYVGAVLGSTLPGLALEHVGWSGVVAVCGGSFALGLWASLFLCHEGEGTPDELAISA